MDTVNVGDTVRRKRGKSHTGRVVAIRTKTTTRGRYEGYQRCAPFRAATVDWEIRGAYGRRSEVRVGDLVRVDGGDGR